MQTTSGAAVTNSFIPPSNFSVARAGQSLTLLPGGDVLMCGGYRSGFFWVPGATTSCQRWSGSIGTWQSSANLSTARAMQSAIVLPNGNTLIHGGFTGTMANIGSTSTVEEFDGTSWITRSDVGTNPGLGSSSNQIVGPHRLTPLSHGTYLLSGGLNGVTAHQSSFIFNL